MTTDILYWLPTGLAILSAIFGLMAAITWYRSSRVYLPDYDRVPVAEYEPGIHSWMQKTSHLNKWAALWTAAAIGLSAASAIAGVLS